MARAQVKEQGQSRRLRIPKDEQEEEMTRRRIQRLQEIALQQLEMCHERTQIAMEEGRFEEADSYSCSTALWMEKLTGG